MPVTRHPSKLSASGPTKPPIPLPQSTTACKRPASTPTNAFFMYAMYSGMIGCSETPPWPDSNRPRSISALSAWIAAPCMASLPRHILNPLYSPGLWLAVIMTPPSTGRVNREKYINGVGHTPISTTLRPHPFKPLSTASRISMALVRPSRATAMVLAPARTAVDPYARAICSASLGVRSFPTTPRMSYSRKMLMVSLSFHNHRRGARCRLHRHRRRTAPR